MRPLELTLEGFKSYRKPQTFSFESRTLFGIVGPTGSGKSSILEGIIFGLYGKTPSVESATKRLINSQEEQARVQLVFETDDVAWEVVRVIRQKGTSQTVLRRLDGVGEPVTGDRNVTDRVTEIVGLDFESFRSSVVLPQGEFDRFLKATPTERSRILKGIFRLDRVDLLREGARTRWQLLEGQIAVHQSTLDGFPDEPEARVKQATTEAAQARALLDEIREELPKVLQAEQEVRSSAHEVSRVQRERSETEAALLRLPAEEALRELAEAHDRAESLLAEAVDALSGAGKLLKTAEAHESRVNAESGGDQWLAAVESGLDARKRLVSALDSAERERSDIESAFRSGEAQLPALQEALRTAEALVTSRRAQVHELQQRHAAHLLRLDLAEGDPCPVCDQPVTAVPQSPPLPALSAAHGQVERAEAELRSSRAAFEAAATTQARTGERMRLAAENAERLQSELDQANNLLFELAPGVNDVGSELARRRAELQEARREAAEARRARDSADLRERRAREELDRQAQRWRDVTHLLSHTCGLLGMTTFSTEGEGLWDSAKRVIETGTRRIEELARRTAQLENAALIAAQTVGSFRTRFSAGTEDQASDVLARARSEVTRLELKIEELQAALRRRTEVEGILTALVARRGRLERLIADFADSKFTAFLLDEQRRLLSRIGSEKFHELTGYYTFDEAGQFQVVDERTGLTRSPETLSGGETFLASLSLALALSEAVALEGGRLGCFFLDEGFGSLDQESLDLALEGIETLADPGRLIGLISHVPGVQARLEDLIVLERLADGSTEVAQHEGPLGYASMLI